jgi:four helix bundle protein
MTHTATNRFAHGRLDAYHVALELYRGVEGLAADLPRGYADLKDQVRRAAAATVRHVAEGANRIHPRDKAARFMVARGEVGEVDAVLEMAAIAGLGGSARVARLRRLADRVGAMLFGLIRREQARA